MSNPYGQAFAHYWNAGWRGILPLPANKKSSPPDGYTGYDGITPSYADCQTWADESTPHNIALRLPDGVIGIDVDAYDGKVGASTLAAMQASLGELPDTYISTSRRDGISGIRLYKVPSGTMTVTKLPGIELIQRHHRYIVAWPSVHPSGNTYQWTYQDTDLDYAPPIAAIPDLPAAWLNALTNVDASPTSKSHLTNAQADALYEGLPEGEPCQHILKAAGKALSGGDRHDSYNEAVLAVIGAARNGCPGAHSVITRMREAFIKEISDRATASEAAAEFDRSLTGALAIVADQVQGTVCSDEVYAWLDEQTERVPEVRDSSPDQDDQFREPTPLERAVQRKALDMRINDQARELLAAERAGQAPPLDMLGLQALLDSPDIEIAWRVAELWPAQGRVLLAAAAKTGKTTMVVNLLKVLADGGEFLDEYTVDPIEGTVAVFNMEVGEQTVKNWLRRAGIINDHKVLIANLRGKASALTLATPQGRQRLADQLRAHNVTVAVLDPLAPVLASLGLDENSNSDVATFFAWWSETLMLAGIDDDLVVHHTGHAGERSRGASRLLDEPDAIWTLYRVKGRPDSDDDLYGPSEERYMRAEGRDVQLAESTLQFDANSGQLSIKHENRKQHGSYKLRKSLIGVIRDNPGATGAILIERRAVIIGTRDDKAVKNELASMRAEGAVDFEGNQHTGFRYWLAGNKPVASVVSSGVRQTDTTTTKSGAGSGVTPLGVTPPPTAGEYIQETSQKLAVGSHEPTPLPLCERCRARPRMKGGIRCGACLGVIDADD